MHSSVKGGGHRTGRYCQVMPALGAADQALTTAGCVLRSALHSANCTVHNAHMTLAIRAASCREHCPVSSAAVSLWLSSVGRRAQCLLCIAPGRYFHCVSQCVCRVKPISVCVSGCRRRGGSVFDMAGYKAQLRHEHGRRGEQMDGQ